MSINEYEASAAIKGRVEKDTIGPENAYFGDVNLE